MPLVIEDMPLDFAWSWLRAKVVLDLKTRFILGPLAPRDKKCALFQLYFWRRGLPRDDAANVYGRRNWSREDVQERLHTLFWKKKNQEPLSTLYSSSFHILFRTTGDRTWSEQAFEKIVKCIELFSDAWNVLECDSLFWKRSDMIKVGRYVTDEVRKKSKGKLYRKWHRWDVLVDYERPWRRWSQRTASFMSSSALC